MENVQDACDELWNCEDAEDVHGRLQVLRRIIPSAPPDSYDPSEAFLAIQGAALRFLPAQINNATQGDNDQTNLNSNCEVPLKVKNENSSFDEKTEAMNWSVTEESLNVAVDLTCLCIGPAWRHQIFRRQQLLALRGDGVDYYHPHDDHSLTSTQSTWAPPSEVLQVGTFRSCSPVTATIISEANNNHNHNNVNITEETVDDYHNSTTSYPPIPEVLPAAMLRFAASVLSFFPDWSQINTMMSPRQKQLWDTRIKNIATAQRLLVVGLCCGSQRTEEETGVQHYLSTTDTSVRWTIPGANELVGNMLVFWLRSAYPLDQVSTGQLSSLDQNSISCDPSDSERERFTIDWLHILGVTRAATDLVSTGWRPLAKTDVGPIVIRYLLDIAQSGISLLNPMSALDGQLTIVNAGIKKEFIIAVSSTTESISALLALASRGLIHHGSQKLTTRTICRIHVVSGLTKASLMGVSPIEANHESRHPASSYVEDQETFLQQLELCFAETADFLCAFGDIVALIDTFKAVNPRSEECSLFSSVEWTSAKKIVCMEAGTALRMTFAAERKPDGLNTEHLLTAMRGLITAVYSKVHELLTSTSDEEEMYTVASDLLSLALDTVVALGHFVDLQLAGDGAYTSVLAWEQFFQALEEAYVPWEGYATVKIDRQAGSGYRLQSIIEQAHLERTSLFLRVGAFLDKCVRIEGSPFHSVVDFEIQKSLYIFILRTVAPRMDPLDCKLLGLTTFRAWVKFAFSPFRCTEWADSCIEILSEAFAVYENSEYVHSPQVRAEALRSLTLDDDKFQPSESTDKASQVSILTVSRDLAGIHEKVTPCLITILHTILSGPCCAEPTRKLVFDETRGFRPIVLPNFDLTSSGPKPNLSTSRSSCLLESFAIKLTGRLVREASTDAPNRTHLIGLLQAAALDPRWAGLGLPDTKSLEDQLKGTVRLAAVVELGRCFVVPFGISPLLHGMTPQILEALHTIIGENLSFGGSTEDDVSRVERSSLVYAALAPLCRMRLCSDGKTVCLIPISKLSSFVSPMLSSLLGPSAQDNERVWFAPLIEVEDVDFPGETGERSKHSPKKTMISLQPVVSAMIQGIVSAEQFTETSKDDVITLIEGIATLCNHSLTSFLLSGFPLHAQDKYEDIVRVSGIRVIKKDNDVDKEMIHALTLLSECEFARLSNQPGAPSGDSTIQTAMTLFRRLLPFCDSTLVSNAIIAIILSAVESKSLEVDDNTFASGLFSQMVHRLHEQVRVVNESEKVQPKALNVQAIGSLLVIMHEILTEARYEIPQPVLLDGFHACKETIYKTLSKEDNHYIYMAIRCLTSLVDRLYQDNAEMLFSRCGDPEDPIAEKPTASTGLTQEFINGLEYEILNHRIVSSSETRGFGVCEPEPEPDGHQKLAMEVERIENFETEKDVQSGLPVKASWLCGRSVLLTFRVGSSSSRYRGWVELVLRSPTFRKRTMVRLLPKFSIRNPDLPSLLWSADTEPQPVEEPPEAPLDSDTASILENYQSLISRFEALIPPNTDENDSLVEASISDGSLFPHTNATVTVSHFGSRSVDNDNTPARSFQNTIIGKKPRAEALLSERSIDTWLGEVLDDQYCVGDVICALERLNVSIGTKEWGKNNDNPDRPPCFIPTQRLRGGPKLDRAVAMLDRIIPMNTHKIALLYAGPKRSGSNESDLESTLLSTPHGSPTYHTFSQGLGEIIPIKQLRYFSAGLDVSKYEADGRYARVWVSPVSNSVVVYHAVHLMPDGLNTRKRHIGNDNVLIIFVDKDSPVADDVSISAYDMKDSVVSGHFGFVTIFILALPERGLARVSVCLKRELPAELHSELHPFVSDDVVAIHLAPAFVRGLAVRADLACRSVLHTLPPPCNSYERYQILRGMERQAVN